MATKALKEKYEDARTKYRKSGKEADKKKFMEVRQEYIVQRQKDKETAAKELKKKKASTKKK